MASLTPGTQVEGSSDPRTVEQNQTIASIQSPDTSAIQPKYGGFLMTPDGKLTNDLSILNIPEGRREEVARVLAAKSVVMMLNVDGIPVQYYPTGVAQPEPPAPPPAPAPVPPAMAPVQPVQAVDVGDIVKISRNQFKKTYVQDRMATLESDSIVFENISVGFSVNVTIEQIATYTTDIVTFELQPKEKREVKIIYDTVEINSLPEGTVKIFPSVSYTAKSLYKEPPVEPPVVIVPKTEPKTGVIVVSTPEPEPTPPLPVVEPSPPTYVEPRIIPFGRWILTKVSEQQTTTEKVIRFIADENGQLLGERNNYVGGVYKTVFGTYKTTTIPAQYDYVLEGDILGAGPKPSVQNESERVTYSGDEVLENTLLYQREGDILETKNIATQMNVPVPVPETKPFIPEPAPYVEPVVEQTASIEVLRKAAQVLIEEPVIQAPEPQVSSGGGGELIYNQQDEQVSFYRRLSQLEYAE